MRLPSMNSLISKKCARGWNPQLLRRRCFQSRAEYDEWTQRMKDSRMIIGSGMDVHRIPITEGANKAKGLRQQCTNSRQLKRQLTNAKTVAPFLHSVSPISDRLLLYSFRDDDNGDAVGVGKTPFSSMLECIYPLSESRCNGGDDMEILRASVSDFGSWSSFRLAKFYSDVDALTADVAYRHTSAHSHSDGDGEKEKEDDCRSFRREENIAFVTAGHYHSRKIHRTDITKDIILRCYPTHTGRSSMEIRTDVIQKDQDGNEVLVNVCFTAMVAVDKDTLRPVKDENLIPKLIPPPDANGEEEDATTRQRMRSDMANQHARIRKERFATSMQLRHGPSSSPPTPTEMSLIHCLHQRVIEDGQHHDPSHSPLPRIRDYTFRSSVVVYPERRNVHGKLFGGFVMEQGHILAQYAADFYLHHYDSISTLDTNVDTNAENGSSLTPPSEATAIDNRKKKKLNRAIPLGLDEAIFLQPIGIGDHVTFTARVVYSTKCTCRVVVTVEVRDPTNRHAAPLRSNRLSFLFGGTDFPSGNDNNNDNGGIGSIGGGIVPFDYREILMHVDAKRKMDVEGPSDDEVGRILSEVGIVGT